MGFNKRFSFIPRMHQKRLLPVLLMLAALITGVIAEPVNVKLVWKARSVSGVAYSTCAGDGLVYVVGYTGDRSSPQTWIEARRATDGQLVRNSSIGPGTLYSCSYSGGKLLVSGTGSDGRWLIGALTGTLVPERVLAGVKGTATSIAVKGDSVFITGVDFENAWVRVEERRASDLSLIKSYQSMTTNTYAFTSTITNNSLWLAGAAYTGTEFTWRLESLSLDLNSTLRLRPSIRGLAYSISASDKGVVYVTGPNGTLALSSNGDILSTANIGGGKIAVLDGVLAVFSSKDKNRLILLNATDLSLISTIELSENPGVESYGAASTINKTIFFAGAEKNGEKTVWSVYSVEVSVSRQVHPQSLPEPSKENSTSSGKPSQAPPSVQPVPITDYVSPILMTATILLAVIVARRKKRR